VIQHGLGVTLGAVSLGFLVIPITWRPKAASKAGSIYSGSADLLLPDGKHLPGQLSLTPTGLAWVPSSYSLDLGVDEVSMGVEDAMAISLERGPGLLDLIITARTRNGQERRFMTHQNRHLRRAVEQLTG
jgi:hypothetical protein